jgi:hypothetical protein
VFVLNAMTDNSTFTMVARWRQSMDRAFKAVENVGLAGEKHFERLVVLISTHFTG